MAAAESICPGCGLEAPAEKGPTHAYMLSSPACWARFGEVLAREFQDQEYFRVHQLTVDAYAVQHPGEPERRTIQSVALHLMTLKRCLEDGVDPGDGPAFHRRTVARRPQLTWLEPPEMRGTMTVADVLVARDAVEHERLVRSWAKAVWSAWSPHHETVRHWVALIGESQRPG